MRKSFSIALACAILLGAGMTFFAPKSSDAARVPGGSYARTCKNVVVKDGKLYATCQTSNGKWRKTWMSMEMLPCNDISNENGNLICK